MTRPSQLTKALVEAGLDRRPMRSPSELIDEHRELLAFAASIRDVEDGVALPALRIVAARLLARCEAPTAEERAA